MEDTDFPETFLPRVARAADRAMREVLDEDRAIDAALGNAVEIPVGLRPRRRG